MAQPNPVDVRKLLKFFENLFAHSLALNDMVENPDDVDETTYPRLKAKYDVLAAERFDIFYRALDDPEGFSKAVRAFLDNNPKTIH